MLLIACEFDGTIVSTERLFEDTESPFELIPGALRGLRSLRAAGHVLLLFSARANRANRENATLDPLVRSGRIKVDAELWAKNRAMYQARYEHMVNFVTVRLPGIFDAIDDGLQGKPAVDLLIDAKTIGLVPGVGWSRIVHLYGG